MHGTLHTEVVLLPSFMHLSLQSNLPPNEKDQYAMFECIFFISFIYMWFRNVLTWQEVW